MTIACQVNNKYNQDIYFLLNKNPTLVEVFEDIVIVWIYILFFLEITV